MYAPRDEITAAGDRRAGPLRKLYVEPTSHCNLACRTCLRNVWDEPSGHMTDATFRRLLHGLRICAPTPSVLFGGWGEPLAHPDILDMVRQVAALGARTELITNGTLLSERAARDLIRARLDTLWVSLDGATPESYADVRLGAALPQVLANVARFRDVRGRRIFRVPTPEIGIVFVAMRRNLADWPAMLRLAETLGASAIMVTNLLPHTADMRDEVLYARSLHATTYLTSPWVPRLSLPKMDVDDLGPALLDPAVRSGRNVTFAGGDWGSANDRCRFIEQGAAAVAWTGAFSPCPPLMHRQVSYLDGRERISHPWVIGNVAERGLSALWDAPEHLAFRERVRAFDFAPCVVCGGCDLSGSNEADCYGNGFPTCGGCLWAQGVIQCP